MIEEKLLTDANDNDTENVTDEKQDRLWLESAFPLSIQCSDDEHVAGLVEQLFHEIKNVRTKKFKSPDQTKKALETIIGNLAMGLFMGTPIYYSRDRNYYTENKKYGSRNLTYEIVKAITDGLEQIGYINKYKGRSFYEDKTRGNQTRMWATQKLEALLNEQQIIAPACFYKPELEELIQLTNKVKIKTKNKEGKAITKVRKYSFKVKKNKLIKKMEADLQKYNDFVYQNEIILKLNHQVRVNYQILFTLYKNILNKKITVLKIDYIKLFIPNTSTQEHNTSDPTNNTHTHITQMFGCRSLIDKAFSVSNGNDDKLKFLEFIHKKYDEYNKILAIANSVNNKKLKAKLHSETTEEFNLGKIGIDNICLRLNHETIHRIFSRKSFNKGGRLYGTVVQSLPEHIRKHILINGEETFELDYKAHHIKMLYHIKGEDYTDDPYIACAGKEYEKVFKTALLVSINCRDERSAMTTIQQQLKRRGIKKPNVKNPFKWIVQKIKETHPKIADCIYADKGVELQKKDSHIMNAILMKLMDKGILGLPIHDSVIVAEPHETTLWKVMTEEYQNAMGFKPKIS